MRTARALNRRYLLNQRWHMIFRNIYARDIYLCEARKSINDGDRRWSPPRSPSRVVADSTNIRTLMNVRTLRPFQPLPSRRSWRFVEYNSGGGGSRDFREIDGGIESRSRPLGLYTESGRSRPLATARFDSARLGSDRVAAALVQLPDVGNARHSRLPHSSADGAARERRDIFPRPRLARPVRRLSSGEFVREQSDWFDCSIRVSCHSTSYRGDSDDRDRRRVNSRERRRYGNPLARTRPVWITRRTESAGNALGSRLGRSRVRGCGPLFCTKVMAAISSFRLMFSVERPNSRVYRGI